MLGGMQNGYLIEWRGRWKQAASMASALGKVGACEGLVLLAVSRSFKRYDEWISDTWRVGQLGCCAIRDQY